MAHLIFQTAFPGDLFLSIPLIKRIRVWNPEAELVLACRPGLGEFFKEFGLVDDFIAVDKRAPGKGRAALARLREREWDTIFVPHESFRTAWWMTSLRAKRKVGFAKWWNRFMYDARVVRPIEYPDALRQLSLLAAVDGTTAELFAEPAVQELRSPHAQSSPFDFSKPEIPEWASMQVTAYRPSRQVVFLAPGSVWATKRWTSRGYEDLARLLLARGLDVELVGSPSERVLCEQIEAHVTGVGALSPAHGSVVPGKLTNRCGQTSLADLVRRLAEGLAIVTNDSGAMHAAAAAGLPTVAVFGPTTLALGYRPWSNKALVVQRELKCRPCGKHGHARCPIGTHECMESISAASVWLALQPLVAAHHPRSV